MSYEQCTSLLDTGADCLPISSLDTNPLSQSSGTHTPARYSGSEQKKAGSPACMCGKGTSDCSIHPSTRGKWIASMRASLALILALPENKQGLALKRAVASTVKPYASLLSFDPATCSWRTSQTSFLTDSEPCLPTFPRSGMTLSGFVYELPIVGRLTNEIDGGFLATPTATSNQLSPSMMKHKGCRALAKAMLSTQTAHDAKKGAYPSEYTRNTPGIGVILGGRPSPLFQEWQMGWPINHTALKASATGRFRCKPPSPGSCSEGLEA